MSDENEILSDEEELALQDKLYEDIKSGRITTMKKVLQDRDWQTRLAVYRVRCLIEAGRVSYKTIDGEAILFARSHPKDVFIDGISEGLIGLTLTRISRRTAGNGDEFTVFHFGETFYEFLSAFTANDHQVAIAKEALESLAMYDGSPSSATAEEALRKMREATTWRKPPAAS